MRLRFVALLVLLCPVPSLAQQLPEGQGETEFRAAYDSSPGFRGGILSFEAWQQAAGVEGVLPTWQVVRTASMWRECGGPQFEVAPFAEWQHISATLRFIKNHVQPVIGEVEALLGRLASARGQYDEARAVLETMVVAPMKAKFQPSPRRIRATAKFAKLMPRSAAMPLPAR